MALELGADLVGFASRAIEAASKADDPGLRIRAAALAFLPLGTEVELKEKAIDDVREDLEDPDQAGKALEDSQDDQHDARERDPPCSRITSLL